MNNLNQIQLVCPHCWNLFYNDEALYIATHPELYGDEVLGETENKRFTEKECSRDRLGIVRDPKGSVVRERACMKCHLQIPPELLTARGKILSVVGAPQAGKTYFLTSMLHQLRGELPTNFALLLRDSDSRVHLL